MVLAAVRRSHRRAVEEAAAARGAGRHVLAADELRRNEHERLQSPGHEPTQRDDYSTSAPLPDPRPGATSGVVGPLPRRPGTAADRRPAPAGLLAASDRRRAGPASVDDQTRAGSAPIPRGPLPAADRRPRRTAATRPPTGQQACRQQQAAAAGTAQAEPVLVTR